MQIKEDVDLALIPKAERTINLEPQPGSSGSGVLDAPVSSKWPVFLTGVILRFPLYQADALSPGVDAQRFFLSRDQQAADVCVLKVTDVLTACARFGHFRRLGVRFCSFSSSPVGWNGRRVHQPVGLDDNAP